MSQLDPLNQVYSELVSSLKKKEVIGGIEELLKLHPKKKMKYPSEERLKYSSLHEWYQTKIKSIQQLLKKNEITS